MKVLRDFLFVSEQQLFQDNFGQTTIKSLIVKDEGCRYSMPISRLGTITHWTRTKHIKLCSLLYHMQFVYIQCSQLC